MTFSTVPVRHRFDGPAILMHWVSAALVLALIGTGAVMTRVAPGSLDQFNLYQLHKSLGVMLLLLTLIRGAWRAVRPPPPWPLGLSDAGRSAARLAHRALYVGLVVVPIAGWILVSASTINIPTSLFGLATWPHLPVLSDLDRANRAAIEPILSRLHVYLAYGLAMLALLHGATAIWHGRIVLARVLPIWPSRTGAT